MNKRSVYDEIDAHHIYIGKKFEVCGLVTSVLVTSTLRRWFWFSRGTAGSTARTFKGSKSTGCELPLLSVARSEIFGSIT
ncbi:hypothetical protein MTR_5g064030 [Medicago truncatula]|uniref:Uncharacterized protein n=1 Tax=Medicago truncatula TaxID=3880 RepID=G7KB99_MEDTR|nr:hypothetical protein MTR_5g064030 [Medicago truncatula]